jgi:hypothetical protein
MTDHINPLPRPVSTGTYQTCSDCYCWWDLPTLEANEKQDWCAEDSCLCHSSLFCAGYIEGLRVAG